MCYEKCTLTEVATTDTARTGSGYQKTGDLLTLPYTSERAFVKQPYATRVENVQTYLIQEWVGKINLDPTGDEWFEKRKFQHNKPQEGNFDSILQEKKKSRCFRNCLERMARSMVWCCKDNLWRNICRLILRKEVLVEVEKLQIENKE